MTTLSDNLVKYRQQTFVTSLQPIYGEIMNFKALTLVSIAALIMSSGASAQELEVMHWWTSPGESKAVKVLADSFNASGGKWVDTAVAGTGVARKAINTRLMSGDAPGAAHFNLGLNLQEAAQEGFLTDLSDVAKRENWAAVIPAAVLKSVSVDGKVYGVPVALHGASWVWYSPKVLKAAGVPVPKTIDELFASAEKIKKAGYLPFAVSSQSWQLNYVYNSLVLGIGGRQAFEQLGRGDGTAYETPTGLKALDLLARIRSYADPAANNRSWNDTTNLILSDKAAFQFMGDWAKAEFLNAGKKPGADFGCMLVPGAQNVYVFTGDGFGFTKKVKAETVTAQRKLVSTLMDKKTEAAFAAAKGSIPVRTDVPVGGLDACAAIGMKVAANGSAVIPNINVTLTGDQLGAHYDGLAKYWSTPTMNPTEGARNLASVLRAAK
jgi:glucose/mannose transport system substrate-binding protein